MEKMSRNQLEILIAFLSKMISYWEAIDELKNETLLYKLDAQMTDQLLDFIVAYDLPSLEATELLHHLMNEREELEN